LEFAFEGTRALSSPSCNSRLLLAFVFPVGVVKSCSSGRLAPSLRLARTAYAREAIAGTRAIIAPLQDGEGEGRDVQSVTMTRRLSLLAFPAGAQTDNDTIRPSAKARFQFVDGDTVSSGTAGSYRHEHQTPRSASTLKCPVTQTARVPGFFAHCGRCRA
jgi:hypothetical protein